MQQNLTLDDLMASNYHPIYGLRSPEQWMQAIWFRLNDAAKEASIVGDQQECDLRWQVMTELLLRWRVNRIEFKHRRLGFKEAV